MTDRPRPMCRICGARDVALDKGRCGECVRRTDSRVALGTAEGKLRSWGDVDGQLDLFEEEC